MSNQNNITEAEVRRVVQRAWKQTLTQIINEPRIFIEFSPEDTGWGMESFSDICLWLFNRKEELDEGKTDN